MVRPIAFAVEMLTLHMDLHAPSLMHVGMLPDKKPQVPQSYLESFFLYIELYLGIVGHRTQTCHLVTERSERRRL
jgi:hypothetical protein